MHDEHIARRLWASVAIGSVDECWPRGSTGTYTMIRVNGRRPRAHIVAWELFHGQPFPEGKQGCHSCDNPPCCNPHHVWPGTHAENHADKVAKKRHAHGERCRPKRGDEHWARQHPENIANGNRLPQAKLAEAVVVMIRKRYANGGITMRELGEEYGVTKNVIKDVIHRNTWKHVE